MQPEYQDISIDKEGKWFFGKAEMFRRNILNILARNIERAADGSWFIKMGQEQNPLLVADVPFLATAIMEQEEVLTLRFHDLQELPLTQPTRLYLKGDVPYISFRWEADTRLSRGVYWKLSDYFDFRTGADGEEEIYIVPPPATAARKREE